MILRSWEGYGPDRGRSAGFEDFELLGRARAKVRFGGLDTCVTEPDREAGNS